MIPIAFTQFLLPDGRQRPTTVDRPKPIADMASELVAAGCRLECEILTTGEVSFTVEHEETIAIEIVPNGPGVEEAVDKLICDAHRELKLHEQGLKNSIHVE